jgi:hypothetical protein
MRSQKQQQADVLETIEPPGYPLTQLHEYCGNLWLNDGKSATLVKFDGRRRGRFGSFTSR